MATGFLFLNESDMVRAGVLEAKECVETIEEVFRLVNKGDYIMGGPSQNEHGTMLHFPEYTSFPNMPVKGPDRRFMAMIAYLGGTFNIAGVKWYGSNVENVKRGLPRSVLTLILNNVITGEPIAFMSANLLSSMRTGAVIGVAAKYLSSRDSEILGIIGAGVINRAVLLSLAEVLPKVKKIKVYDIFPSKAEEFCRKMSERTGLNIVPVSSIEETVKDSDVVHAAASGTKAPSIETKWVKEGAMIGMSSACILQDDLINRSNIVLDQTIMHEAWYEMDKAKHMPVASSKIIDMVKEGKMKKEDISNLGSIIESDNKHNFDSKKNTVFIPFGMAVEDIAWGYNVYKRAVELGIGQQLTLWDKPTWF